MTPEEVLEEEVRVLLLKAVPGFVRGMMSDGIDWVAKNIVKVSSKYVEAKIQASKTPL